MGCEAKQKDSNLDARPKDKRLAKAGCLDGMEEEFANREDLDLL